MITYLKDVNGNKTPMIDTSYIELTVKETRVLSELNKWLEEHRVTSDYPAIDVASARTTMREVINILRETK